MKHLLYSIGFSLCVLSSSAQLSGNYTIYSPYHLHMALTAVKNQGLSGNVVFRLNPGNYSSLVMENFTQTSSGRRIHIRSANGNANSVIFSSIAIDNSDYINFRDIMIHDNSSSGSGALSLTNSDRFRMDECTIEAHDDAVVILGSSVSDLRFDEVTIHTSSNVARYAIKQSCTSLSNLQVYECNISGPFHSALDLDGFGSTEILYNSIDLSNGNCLHSPLSLQDITGDLEVIGNTMLGFQGYTGCSSPLVLIENTVNDPEVLFVNNMFSSRSDNVHLGYTDGVIFINNSFRSHAGRGITRNGHLNGKLYAFNNAFQTSDYCISWEGNTSLESDHNIYYRNHSWATQVLLFNNYICTLPHRQSTSSQDQNSIFGDPLFLSTTDLHLSGTSSPAYKTGMPLSQSEEDIDHEDRGKAYDIGADEISAGKSADQEPVLAAPQPSKLSIGAYPNPSRGQFQLIAEVTADANYRVLDLQGRVVAQGVFQKGFVTLQDIAPGQYLIQVIEGQRLGITSIIIE